MIPFAVHTAVMSLFLLQCMQ